MRYLLSAAAIAVVLAAMPARADDCGTLMNTMIAQASNPYAATITMEIPGQPARTTKAVFIHDIMYTQIEGKWRSMPMSAKETAGMIRDAAKTAKETCHVQGNDSVNGQSATLYVAHVENKGSISDNKVWVSGGKILKTEVQIQGGPHMVTVLDYANVAPPAGATPIGPPPQH